ncbi:MAG: hypothetical protein GW939_04105 [Candidatus Magasanikbacteria bacterium]|uniref:Transcription regulator TrmB N-terminal domain-containing protein n=1 Tax=Candidatus Magasanikbacteria bacterium CG10_big_fil_rev_8_21_14_0_10_38_6 TaxID=1974647 RepID=A0A2M6P0T4_9BACT|nr:hypothetical protein [Candidatus Magasanikbacteria bacterium]PIR77311.1 MAG: hypothetical protein COU30_03165 [Candidatus Magasanikbacteria bacterium CG10_big_fil_rev_8_21_14_0_10_38_6]
MHFEALEHLGLSEKDAEVYQTLLKIGPSTIQTILDAVPYKRGDLYNIITSLEEWDLIEKKETDKKKTYTAKHPSKLEDIIQRQHQELEQQKNTLQDVLGNLTSMYNLSYHKQGVQYFEGKQGIINAYEKLLDIREPIDSIEDKGEMGKFISDYLKKFIKKRISREIFNRVIAPSTNEINITSRKELRETRTIKVTEFPFEMDIKICKNTLLFVTLKKESAIAIMIEDPIIAHNFRILFQFLWHQATKRVLSPKEIGENNSDVTVFNT